MKFNIKEFYRLLNSNFSIGKKVGLLYDFALTKNMSYRIESKKHGPALVGHWPKSLKGALMSRCA